MTSLLLLQITLASVQVQFCEDDIHTSLPFPALVLIGAVQPSVMYSPCKALVSLVVQPSHICLFRHLDGELRFLHGRRLRRCDLLVQGYLLDWRSHGEEELGRKVEERDEEEVGRYGARWKADEDARTTRRNACRETKKK